MSSVRVRYLDRDAVLAKLRQLAAEIGSGRPAVQEVRLFGSLARGERNPFADAIAAGNRFIRRIMAESLVLYARSEPTSTDTPARAGSQN